MQGLVQRHSAKSTVEPTFSSEEAFPTSVLCSTITGQAANGFRGPTSTECAKSKVNRFPCSRAQSLSYVRMSCDPSKGTHRLSRVPKIHGNISFCFQSLSPNRRPLEPGVGTAGR